MIGTTIRGTGLFLNAVAAQVDGAHVRSGDFPGACPWVRIPTRTGFIGVWDAEELGEHGLFVQAYDLTPTPPADTAGGVGVGETVTSAGSVAWIHERATVAEGVQAVRAYVEGYTRQTSIPQPPKDAPTGSRWER